MKPRDWLVDVTETERMTLTPDKLATQQQVNNPKRKTNTIKGIPKETKGDISVNSTDSEMGLIVTEKRGSYRYGEGDD